MPEPMTDAEAEEIRERYCKATPGEWKCDERVGCIAVYPGEKHNCLSGIERGFVHYKSGTWVETTEDLGGHWTIDEQHLADATFIAHSHQDIPALFLERDRLKAEVERLESDVEKLTSDLVWLRRDVP